VTDLPTRIPESAESSNRRPNLLPRQPLIHPLSHCLLIIVDALWTIPDMAAFAWIATIPACFLAVAIPTYLIQKFMKNDPAGKSACGCCTSGRACRGADSRDGNVVGAIVLALSGLRSLGGKR